MKRVIFVDDEQHVLDGLKNLLRKQRHQLDMSFALGGQAALDELAKAPFDVVVSDMRMPGMDGVALLQRVKEQYPATARIVLSGHAERDMVVRALPVSHQYLSKPCDADTLRQVILRACELRDLLKDQALQAVVGRLDRLPSVPDVYWELTRALADPEADRAKIAGILERDVAMSVKLLQIVNSAYFGLARRVSSVAEAVSFLGIELVKGLALGAQVFAALDGAPAVPGFSLTELQRHAVAVARLARRVMRTAKLADEAFTAGMVHDVGRVILALALPERCAELLAAAAAANRPLHDVEKDLLGVTHAELGAYLLGTWGLPIPIVEAVAFHHTPAAAKPAVGDVLLAVHVADGLLDEATSGGAGGGPFVDEVLLAELGAGAELPRWRALAGEAVGGLKEAA